MPRSVPTTSSRLRRASRPPFRRTVAGGLLAVSVGLTGACGLRLETPPPAPATLDAAELARAGAIADAETIAAAARAAGADPAAGVLADRLTEISAASTRHVDRLGDVWEAPEGQEPTDSPTAQEPSGDLPGLLAALTTGYDDARSSLADAPGATAPLLASIALWRALAAHEVVASGALPADVADAAALPTGGVDRTALALATVDDADALIRGLDAAAYAYEAVAAGSEDAALQADWNGRAAQLRRTGELVATRAGVAGTRNDPRETLYDVSGILGADPTATAVALETEVAALWVATPLPGTARAVGLDAALEALLRARALAPLGPLDGDAVVLPGLTGSAA